MSLLQSASGIKGACDGVFTLDLNQLWNPSGPLAKKNPGAGAVVQLQLAYRDQGGIGLSDALEFYLAP